MSTPHSGGSRMRAYLRFILAVLWFFAAHSLARSGAQGLTNEQLTPLVEQAMLLFLLLSGYACLGFWIDRQPHPLNAQGLPRRAGWPGEAGLGLALGWALAVVCVLALVADGGVAIVLVLQLSAWKQLAIDLIFFALAALAEEVAFRGYGFQRLIDAVGPMGATLGIAAYYAIVQSLLPGASHASFAVSVAFSLALSLAYLRTRALWVGWGINFGWKAGRALVFGLAISGVSSHSPVVEGNPMGAFWLTGGGFGLDASWFAFVVLLLAIPVVYRVTRDLDFIYNAPVIIAAGIPVDLSAAAHQQHEAAIGAVDPAPSGLVQIAPTPAQPPRSTLL
jgi:membrane protease YdiL (CAAX protease family)